jgi:hypothetical protein
MGDLPRRRQARRRADVDQDRAKDQVVVGHTVVLLAPT